MKDPSTSSPLSQQVGGVYSRGFWCFAIAILLIASVTRLWDLGSRPFHADEAVHADWSWALANDLGYTFDPAYHGPFLYYLTGVTFKLFGDSDFTARLMPALFGVALVGLILFSFPRWLGEAGGVIAALLVTASPAMTCYHRQNIHDSYVLLFSLVMVVSYLHLQEGGRGEYGYALALASAFAICTKANAYLVLLIIASDDYVRAVCRCVRAARQAGRGSKPLMLSGFAIVAGLISACLCLLMAANPAGPGITAMIVAMAIALWLGYRILLASLHHALTQPEKPSRLSGDWHFVVKAVILAFLIYAALYTNGFRVPRGIMDGVCKTFAYWASQQQHPRLPGPLTYHLVLLALYELPTAVAGLAGILLAVAQRTPARAFLAYWAVASLVAYSLASEKVPWLIVHPLLPLALLAGMALSDMLAATAHKMSQVLVYAYLVLGLGLLARGTYAILGPHRADNHEPLLYAQTTPEFMDAFRALDPGPAPPGTINMVVCGQAKWPLFWHLRYRRGIAWQPIEWQEGIRLAILDLPNPSFGDDRGFVRKTVKLDGAVLFHPRNMMTKQPLGHRLRSELKEYDLNKMVAFVLYRKPIREPVWRTVTFHYRERAEEGSGQP